MRAKDLIEATVRIINELAENICKKIILNPDLGQLMFRIPPKVATTTPNPKGAVPLHFAKSVKRSCTRDKRHCGQSQFSSRMNRKDRMRKA